MLNYAKNINVKTNLVNTNLWSVPLTKPDLPFLDAPLDKNQISPRISLIYVTNLLSFSRIILHNTGAKSMQILQQ